MIVFNEGTPGSGKSYDAVASHILPAIKAGRTVYARLNGLNHERIASHLSMPVDRVRELLVHVPTEDVRSLPTLAANDALIVVDEAHEFYTSSREALAPETEDFFAKHRHRGFELVLISQWYKRLHTAVRARIERKAVFTKLTAIGSTSRYTVRHYQNIEPDKFEKLDVQTKAYDSAIFPLYQTAEIGTQNLDVYKAGGVTIWRKLGKWGIVFLLLAAWAVWYIIGFFTGRHHLVTSSAPPPGVAVSAPAQPVAPATPQPGQTAAPGKLDQKGPQLPTNARATIDTAGMTPEAAYIFDLANQGRPRLAAYAEAGGKEYGIVEFRENQGHVLERITFAQLRALGLDVTSTGYGARISAGKSVLIATPWPLDLPGTVSAESEARISSGNLFPTPEDQQQPQRVQSRALGEGFDPLRQTSASAGKPVSHREKGLHAAYNPDLMGPLSTD